MKTAEDIAVERWGAQPKTFDHNRTRREFSHETPLGGQRRYLASRGLAEYAEDELIPDDFPALRANLVAWRAHVNDYNRINGTEY